MSLWNIITNTVEGVAQAAINVVKVPIGVIVAPLDGGDTVEGAAKGIVNGVKKIGSTKEPKP